MVRLERPISLAIVCTRRMRSAVSTKFISSSKRLLGSEARLEWDLVGDRRPGTRPGKQAQDRLYHWLRGARTVVEEPASPFPTNAAEKAYGVNGVENGFEADR